MPFYPTLDETYTHQQVTDVFGGYNHNMRIGDGEFFHMENMTSSYFPLLANRKLRSIYQDTAGSEYRGLLGKAQMAYVRGDKLFYGEKDVTKELPPEVQIRDNGIKQLVSMGSYIIIYPDKIYFNTEDFKDYGRIEQYFEGTPSKDVNVTYTLCKADGTAYATPAVSTAAPANPVDGATWIDISDNVHVLKQYSANTDMWNTVLTTYIKIEFQNIGVGFNKFDGVNLLIDGIGGASDDGELADQVTALSGSKVIYDKGDDYIVVVGIIDQVFTQQTGKVFVSRTMPDLDYITEAGNRLWGCKYGLVNGQTVNEIYCCALGDFKNWSQFMGLSTDSYVASVGTDGPWTGAITHLGYPLFFKENVLHKVYVSSTGAHQINDMACRGVQEGCSNSLAVVNATLYYKSPSGVCVYDGSLPQLISENLGEVKYFNAAAGALGDRYFISMQDADGEWNLFVYDTAKGLWHREDETQASCFAQCGEELYYIDAQHNRIMAVTGSAGAKETEPMSWMVESGIVGYETIEQKYVSRINIRMKLPYGSVMHMDFEYDSSGEWVPAGSVTGMGLNSFTLPLRPRRCDHFRYRLKGTGDVRVYSIARILEGGSDENERTNRNTSPV